VLQKPDGYATEKIINSVTGNIFQVAFDVQATIAVGDVEGVVEIIDSNGSNVTNTFTFEVKENPASSVVVNSKNEIETLQQIIGLIASYNANADNLAVQNVLAIQNKADLTALNTTSETLANRLESDITNGTATAIRLENDIVTGNQLHSNLQQDFDTGGALHNNLLADIANGNYTISQLQGLYWPYIQSMLHLVEISFKGSRLTDGNGNYLTDGSGNYLTM
jgi:plasmid maintenance system antidote protein VapI